MIVDLHWAYILFEFKSKVVIYAKEILETGTHPPTLMHNEHNCVVLKSTYRGIWTGYMIVLKRLSTFYENQVLTNLFRFCFGQECTIGIYGIKQYQVNTNLTNRKWCAVYVDLRAVYDLISKLHSHRYETVFQALAEFRV